MGKILGEAIRRNDLILLKNMEKLPDNMNINTILNEKLDSFEKYVLNSDKYEGEKIFKYKNKKTKKEKFKDFYERFIEEKMDNVWDNNTKNFDEFKNYIKKRESF